MLNMVHKNCETKEGLHSYMNQDGGYSAPIAGTSAMSIFFDELSLALKGKSLAPFIREWIQGCFAAR